MLLRLLSPPCINRVGGAAAFHGLQKGMRETQRRCAFTTGPCTASESDTLAQMQVVRCRMEELLSLQSRRSGKKAPINVHTRVQQMTSALCRLSSTWLRNERAPTPSVVHMTDMLRQLCYLHYLLSRVAQTAPRMRGHSMGSTADVRRGWVVAAGLEPAIRRGAAVAVRSLLRAGEEVRGASPPSQHHRLVFEGLWRASNICDQSPHAFSPSLCLPGGGSTQQHARSLKEWCLYWWLQASRESEALREGSFFGPPGWGEGDHCCSSSSALTLRQATLVARDVIRCTTQRHRASGGTSQLWRDESTIRVAILTPFTQQYVASFFMWFRKYQLEKVSQCRTVKSEKQDHSDHHWVRAASVLFQLVGDSPPGLLGASFRLPPARSPEEALPETYRDALLHVAVGIAPLIAHACPQLPLDTVVDHLHTYTQLGFSGEMKQDATGFRPPNLMDVLVKRVLDGESDQMPTQLALRVFSALDTHLSAFPQRCEAVTIQREALESMLRMRAMW